MHHLDDGSNEINSLAVHQPTHNDHVDGALREPGRGVRGELGGVYRVRDRRDLLGGERGSHYQILPASVADADGVIDAAHRELHSLVQVDAVQTDVRGYIHIGQGGRGIVIVSKVCRKKGFRGEFHRDNGYRENFLP